VVLSSLPQNQHSSMTGLLVIFSALGGTTGSMITGYVFGNFNVHFAFYLTLVLTLSFFKRQMGGPHRPPAIGRPRSRNRRAQHKRPRGLPPS
jgi:hypothetical protein